MCSLAEFVSKNEISHASSKSISWDAISRFSWHVISVPSLLQILKHYSKPGVEAKEVLPLFPDFKVIISCFPFSQNLPFPIPLSFLLPLLSLPSPPSPPSLSLSIYSFGICHSLKSFLTPIQLFMGRRKTNRYRRCHRLWSGYSGIPTWPPLFSIFYPLLVCQAVM